MATVVLSNDVRGKIPSNDASKMFLFIESGALEANLLKSEKNAR